MRPRTFLPSLLLCAWFPAAAAAVAIGDTDRFQDGTTAGWFGQGWVNGMSPLAEYVPSGGPEGTEDGYLRVTSTGAELRAQSDSLTHWRGDYISSGVTAIAMDLRNSSESDLQIRLSFRGNYGDWNSTNAFVLPADGQWHRAILGVTPGDLTWGGQQGGVYADVTKALAHAGGFEIRHQAGSPLGSATPVAAILGVDNITALPEPSTLGMILLAAPLWRRRSR